MNQANILRANKYKKSKPAKLKQLNPEINKHSRKQQGTHKKRISFLCVPCVHASCNELD